MPDIKQVRSALTANVLRLGDVDTRGEEAIELFIKTSKCTSLARPKGWKKFALRENTTDDMDVGGDDDVVAAKAAYAQLRMRTEYYVDRKAGEKGDGDVDMKKEEDDDKNLLDEADHEPEEPNVENLEKVDKEELVRGFKYGTTYVPCPEGQFPKLPTKKGIEICGFFPAKHVGIPFCLSPALNTEHDSKFRRELSMDEIHYIWADPSAPQQQVALSSIVKAMYVKKCMAIARWVSRDGMDPKMGVLSPVLFENIDCLIWSHVSISFAIVTGIILSVST
jgi:ATP-dependent DNA helicase 2 subunit 2